MKNYEREIERIRILYYAVGLPLCLSVEGERVFSIPEEPRTAAIVSGNPELSQYEPDEGQIAQYIRTEGGENYILLKLEGGAMLAAGPFLIEKVPDSFIAELARRQRIKLRCKDAMQQYYASLPLLSKERFFYAGRLMEELFSSASPGKPALQYDETTAAFILPEFYRQTRDYRVQQFLHSPYHVEQEICRAISGGDSVGAHRILNEINSRPRARLAGTALRSLKNSVICSCCFMTRAAISGGVSPDEAFTLSDTYIQTVESCQDIRELLGLESKMVSGFTDSVNSAKGKRYSAAVSQAISFIDTHLCEPISVRTVAEAVYLSPSYLSAIFSRETGDTLHSYIIRRRIEESSYFIRNSTEPIADIASFYQFSSQSHYVRSFRELMGMTPGAYRKGSGSAE